MKNPNDGPGLPPVVLQKLNEVRSEDRRVRFQTGLRGTVAVLLTAMLAAMIIDWLAVLHDTRWRWALTVLSLGAAMAAFLIGCLPALLRPRSLDSIARDVDSTHPETEERFLTLVGIAQSKDPSELRGSSQLLEQVARQAAALSAKIQPAGVVSKARLARVTQYLGGVAALVILLFLVNFQQTKTLFLRFWAPNADITMIKLTAKPGDAVVGAGDDVNLEFNALGKAPKEVKLAIRSADRDEILPLEPSSPKGAKFLYTINGVSESFDYRATAGDGETAWHHIKVMDRPKIAQVKLRIIPPAYSHLPTVEQAGLPRQTRALEGSQLELTMQADQPLAAMQLKFGDGKTVQLSESADHTYQFKATLTNTLAFTPVFTNLQHLENVAKSTCQVTVYPDQPPTVTVITPDNEITARHDDKVKVDFEARDDIGLAKAELVVSVKGATNKTETVIPIPLAKDEQGSRKIRKQVELDLAQLNVKQDQELSYFVRVTDTKENASLSSNDDSQQSDSKPSESENKQSSDSDKKSNKQQAANADGKKPGDNQKHIAMNQPPAKPKASQPSGKPAPPNTMSKRVLDAGQCSSCQPMKIVVDDWGRSFEGQMRDKLEIAIDPVLKDLDFLLASAQRRTDGILGMAHSPEGLSASETPDLHEARDDLRHADSAVTDLKSKTHDTPYAFIGLQVDDIRSAHISPARQKLADVALETNSLRSDLTNLDEGSFQIQQARKKLAELTKTYEEVKRDNKLSDAMQRLAKMHRIFLEDSEALLGSKKPILNPQQRKIAEVSDDYAEKLRKLLEEQKKIMAELAKILANDPRLLRRFMALEQLDGTTLRDQMTVLAERQRTLAKESGQWTNAPAGERTNLLNELLTAQSGEQTEIASMTSKLLENIVTWAPMDVSVDKDPILSCRKYATEAARFSSLAAENLTPDKLTNGLTFASNALEQLRKLQATLPSLDWITDSHENVSAFEANRLNDTAELITRQSGWLKKLLSLQSGDFAQAAEIDQHRLTLDTTTLGEKLDATAISVGSLSPEIKAKAEELNATMSREIIPAQTGAMDDLSHKSVSQASGHQAAATNAFAKGEKQFDELLHLIIAKLDAEPPPSEPGQNKTLEQMLAELKEEQKACEKLGVPCRPLNVQVLKDWMKPGSCSNPSEAQAKASEKEAKKAAQRAEQMRREAKRMAELRVEELPPVEHPRAKGAGPKPPPTSWNTLVSKLGDELRQGRDNVPPEQYRQAIEQYFTTIAERPAAPAAAVH